MFGTGTKAGKCYHVQTVHHDCEEGWDDGEYDTYSLGTSCNPNTLDSLQCNSKSGGSATRDFNFCIDKEDRKYCPKGYFLCNDGSCTTKVCKSGLKLTSTPCPRSSCNPNSCDGLVCFDSDTCGATKDWGHCKNNQHRQACPLGMVQSSTGECYTTEKLAVEKGGGVAVGGHKCPVRLETYICNPNKGAGLVCFSKPGVVGIAGKFDFCFDKADRQYCPQGYKMCKSGSCTTNSCGDGVLIPSEPC